VPPALEEVKRQMAKPPNTTGDGDGKTNGSSADSEPIGTARGSATPTPGAEAPGPGAAGSSAVGATGQGEAPKQAAQAKAPPAMKILGQYLKDLSFENPNSPQSLSQQGQPEINIQVNVNAKPVGQTQTEFEVELHLEAKASNQGKAVFAAELLYAGVFRLENIPQEALHPIVLVECPRMLFPFARQILADATRNGGFPPLMLDPIDFASMYQRRLAEAQKASASA
jgi:preprotein translocase subunit SecB